MKPTTFIEAMLYAQSRGVVLGDEFYMLDIVTRQYASTVKLLSSIEQISQVMSILNKQLADGVSFAAFKSNVAALGIDLPEHYLSLVFRTNIQSAYAQGRYKQQQDYKHARPYLMYSAVDDSRVRPNHLALDGIIRHIDDPFWDTHTPTLGFNCRCSTISLRESKAKKLGITPDDKLPDVQADNGWSYKPTAYYKQALNLLDEKIINSGIENSLLKNLRDGVRLEYDATELYKSMMPKITSDTRTLCDKILATIKEDIRPSAIKELVEFATNKNKVLLDYLQSSANDGLIKMLVFENIARFEKIARNEIDVVIGGFDLLQLSQLRVGDIFKTKAPLLFKELEANAKIHVINAKGQGVDMSKLHDKMQGVIFNIGTAFKVVSSNVVNGSIIYTLQIQDSGDEAK